MTQLPSAIRPEERYGGLCDKDVLARFGRDVDPQPIDAREIGRPDRHLPGVRLCRHRPPRLHREVDRAAPGAITRRERHDDVGRGSHRRQNDRPHQRGVLVDTSAGDRRSGLLDAQRTPDLCLRWAHCDGRRRSSGTAAADEQQENRPGTRHRPSG